MSDVCKRKFRYWILSHFKHLMVNVWITFYISSNADKNPDKYHSVIYSNWWKISTWHYCVVTIEKPKFVNLGFTKSLGHTKLMEIAQELTISSTVLKEKLCQGLNLGLDKFSDQYDNVTNRKWWVRDSADDDVLFMDPSSLFPLKCHELYARDNWCMVQR